MKNLIDHPYLAPLMTPLKWTGAVVSKIVMPIPVSMKLARRNQLNPNPIINYLRNLNEVSETNTSRAAGFVFIGGFLGGIGGAVGGVMMAMKLLAASALPVKIVGGIAMTAASVATAAVVAPVAIVAALSLATTVAMLSVVGLPGAAVGFKKAFDHATGRSAALAAAAPPVPQATTAEQISQHLSGMNEAEQQQVLNLLRNKAGNDFGASTAPAAAELDKDIAVSKAIKLKKPNP